MIAFGDLVKRRRGLERAENRRELRGGAEGVAASLQEQHPPDDGRQVLVPPLLRLAPLLTASAVVILGAVVALRGLSGTGLL